MYKLITIDLDGTLINSQGQITEEDKKAINDIKQKGSIVVINSGRQLETVRNIAKDIGSVDYCVCGNGAQLYDLKNNKVLYSHFLDLNKSMEIIEICRKNDLYFSIYTEKEILVETLKDNVLAFYYNNKNIPYEKQTRIKIDTDVDNYILNERCPILKIGISQVDENAFLKG